MAEAAFPKVSVVMANYNNGACIGFALNSVCTQDPVPHDVVVLDDCSTDNSVEVIDSFVKKYPFVRLIRYPQKSVDWVQALFDNMPQSTGDYIISLSADDYVYPGYVKAVGQMIAQYPQCGAVFTDWHLVDMHRNVIGQMSSTVGAPCFLEGAQLADQICKFNVFESGFAAVVRKDLLVWFNQNKGVPMGPFHDSMGYPVLALKSGACYVPSFLGGCTNVNIPGKTRYSWGIFGDPVKSVQYFQNVVDFLSSPAVAAFVPQEVIEALTTKAMFCFNFNGRESVLWQRFAKRTGDLVRSGRFDMADQWLQHVLQAFPQQAEAYSDWGIVKYALGRHLDAEMAFRRAIELNPNMAAAYCNCGVCMQGRGALAEAEAAYRRALELDPNVGNGLANLGNLLVMEGRWQEALPVQQRLVQQSPQSAPSYASLANTLLALGRLDEALAACRKSIEIDPNLADARAIMDQLMTRLR